MQNALTDFALKLFTPIIIGVLTPFAVDGLKRINAWLANAPAYVKQAAAIAVATVATMLTEVVGVGVPADLTQWDGDVLKALLAGFLAIAIKQHKQLTRGK